MVPGSDDYGDAFGGQSPDSHDPNEGQDGFDGRNIDSRSAISGADALGVKKVPPLYRYQGRPNTYPF